MTNDFKAYQTANNGLNTVIVEGICDFNLRHTFESGQCFRWSRQDDGSYTGVVKGRVLNVAYAADKQALTINNSNMDDFYNIWCDYFDLRTDYGAIKKKLSGVDEIMAKAVSYGYGLRLLRQDFWETLVSFIISANNRIPSIINIISNISKNYGDMITSGYPDGGYFAFPQPERLSCLNEREFMLCSRGGYRCGYIIGASKAYLSGAVKKEELALTDTVSARKAMMSLPGVGPKVADCVMLYSGTRYDVFPTDVWIKRAVEKLYFDKQVPLRQIHQFASLKFGSLAGYAQQYLFFYARENNIGK